jgi:hypothetical protein
MLIALGTLLLSAGGLLNAAVDEMDGFAISLVAGISVIFVGFLLTTPRPPATAGGIPRPAALPVSERVPANAPGAPVA